MKRYLECDNDKFGEIGERVGYYDYCVGDIVAFNICSYEINVGVIVYSPSNHHYSIFGWCIDDVRQFKNIKKIVSFKNINQEMIQDLSKNLSIIEIEEKEMTLEEIEATLGYKIKLKS